MSELTLNFKINHHEGDQLAGEMEFDPHKADRGGSPSISLHHYNGSITLTLDELDELQAIGQRFRKSVEALQS